jgi:predicted nucleic-acid-binding Zn-ribbon protein
MFVDVEDRTMYIYKCSKCGYNRKGVLDHPMYSTQCPKCKIDYDTIEVVEVEE